ncbi:MAG TPA: hypothetical protein VG734_25600 [Lacunisphaera sp.]|nr:hypothetical protein [Lacunisphaera sp.]
MTQVFLVGADDVERAGRNIAAAADAIDGAARNFDHSANTLAQRLEAVAVQYQQAAEVAALAALLNHETVVMQADLAGCSGARWDVPEGTEADLKEALARLRGG